MWNFCLKNELKVFKKFTVLTDLAAWKIQWIKF